MALRHRAPRLTVRAYARRLVLRRWHSIWEWRATVAIVTPESHFDACSVFPSRHDCFYMGANSCGIPQANPCPLAWRGRLYRVRFVQIRWLVDYIASHYGDPLHALAFHEANGWY